MHLRKSKQIITKLFAQPIDIQLILSSCVFATIVSILMHCEVNYYFTLQLWHIAAQRKNESKLEQLLMNAQRQN